MTALTQGANTAVAAPRVRATLAWPAQSGELDASAYLLTASGKVRNDDDMVFYNQPSGAGGAIKVISQDPGKLVFELDLPAMPAVIERVVFCLTADGKTLSAFSGAHFAVADTGGATVATFAPDLARATEAAMMVAELYLRNGQWKVRAVAQGFNGGLAPLARSFGIDVAEPEPVAAPPVAPPPPPPPPANKPISLSKITLDKAKPTISLEKQGQDFGEVTINLNWSRGSGGGGFFGKAKSIDLDLGCLFELHDGTKGIVQALGNSFGAYNTYPFIALSGDDRTGDVAAGETLRINGVQWNQIARIALYAYIYEGVPNWQATDGVITIKMPAQPPIEIRLSDGNNNGFCGIALIENDHGSMKFTRLVEYFRGHREFDNRVGWGMSWRAASK